MNTIITTSVVCISVLPGCEDAVSRRQLHPGTLDWLAVLGAGLGVVQRYGRAHVAVAGPEQRGSQGLMDGVGDTRPGITEDSRAVERDGGEVMAEVGVRGGDTDGLAGVEAQTGGAGAVDGGQNPPAGSAGVHLLEMQQGVILVWGRGSGHLNYSLTFTRLPRHREGINEASHVFLVYNITRSTS